MVKVLFIVAQDGFRDEELFEPKKVLEDAGVECVIASVEAGVCTGKLGGSIEASRSVRDCSADEFDALVLVGGPGAKVFFDDTGVHGLYHDADSQGKVLAAICVSPTTLANAGLLQGKKATVWKGERWIENLKEKGAQYQGEGVFIDGRVVTASGPDVAKKFGEKLLELLS